MNRRFSRCSVKSLWICLASCLIRIAFRSFIYYGYAYAFTRMGLNGSFIAYVAAIVLAGATYKFIVYEVLRNGHGGKQDMFELIRDLATSIHELSLRYLEDKG